MLVETVGIYITVFPCPSGEIDREGNNACKLIIIQCSLCNRHFATRKFICYTLYGGYFIH